MNGSSPTYRFAQAAQAVGVTEAALRNWMTRNKLDLSEGRPERGWRQFSESDVFVLGLAVELVNYGAVVGEAVEAARIGLADTNYATLEGLPRYLYAARSRFGGWEIGQDNGMVRELSGARSVIEIAVPIVLAGVRRRLTGDSQEHNV